MRAPAFATSVGARRAVGIIAAAIGSTLTAATSGESFRTSWRYCRITKVKPKNAKNCAKIEMLPAASVLLRKMRGSSSGCSLRSSTRTKTTPATIARAKPSSVRAPSQPWSGASMIE